MDRNYFCRILGVRPDATPNEIRRAYDDRVRRLNSSDYADEPEYARRKREQARQAYRVLTGGEVPVEPEKSNKMKLSLEDDIKDVLKVRRKATKKSPVTKAKKNITVATVITVALAVMGLMSSVFTLIGNSSYDYEVDEYTAQQIDNAQSICLDIDYYSGMDKSTIDENDIRADLYQGWGEYGEDPLANDINDLLLSLDIYSQGDFFAYATGIGDYYYDYDDYDLADTLINWLGAPDFDEIAGATNLYTGEVMLNSSDYINYLQEHINRSK